MKNDAWSTLALTLGLLSALPLWAHHSVSAEFDTSKSFTVKGTLTKIEWVNPHAYVYVDSKSDQGVVTAYSFETGPPGLLRRAGVLRTMLSVGDAVTIEAWAAKDGTQHLGLVKAFHFADGHTIVIGKEQLEPEKTSR